jgi:hypothetical protein
MVRYPTALLVTGSVFTPLSVNYCRMTGTMRTDYLRAPQRRALKRGHCHPHQKFRDGEHCKPAASRRPGPSSNTLAARARYPGQSDTPPFERQRNDRPVSPLTFENGLLDAIPGEDRCSGKGWPCSSGRANHFLCEFPFQAANWRPEVTSKRGRGLLRCGVGTLICGRGMLICGMLTGPALAAPPDANANVPTIAK